MALLHSFFGLGGTVAPFISTPFVQHFPKKPYLLYTINLAVALLTLSVETAVFRGQTEEQLTGKPERMAESTESKTEAPMPLAEMGTAEAEVAHRGAESQVPSRPLLSSSAKMKIILTTPAVYVFVLHAFLYVRSRVCHRAIY
jgi:hypothetical protein